MNEKCSKCKCSTCVCTHECEGGCANCGISIKPRLELDAKYKYYEEDI